MSGVLAGWRAAEGGLAVFRRLMEVYVFGVFTTPWPWRRAAVVHLILVVERGAGGGNKLVGSTASIGALLGQQPARDKFS